MIPERDKFAGIESPKPVSLRYSRNRNTGMKEDSVVIG